MTQTTSQYFPFWLPVFTGLIEGRQSWISDLQFLGSVSPGAVSWAPPPSNFVPPENFKTGAPVYRPQIASRASDKQKMLDVLSLTGLLPSGLSRSAADYPELSGELHNAIIGFLALTPSQLLAINQEDLTKELDQQNLPGTTWQYPNWGRKMRLSVEQLRSDAQARGFTAMFAQWIEKSGRRNQPAP